MYALLMLGTLPSQCLKTLFRTVSIGDSVNKRNEALPYLLPEGGSSGVATKYQASVTMTVNSAIE
jgi:hypothetical protein